MNGIKKLLFSFVIMLFVTILSRSIFATSIANFPFPQNLDYPGVLKPAEEVNQEIMNNQVKTLYVDWVKTYVRPSNGQTPGGYYTYITGMYPPADGISDSKTHGQSMKIFTLMAGADLTGISGSDAILDAKIYFDGYFKIYNTHRSVVNPHLMSWTIPYEEDITKNSNSNVEGDMEIAYALLLAHDQWGSDGAINYIGEAQRIITFGIKVSEVSLLRKFMMLGDHTEWTSYIKEYGSLISTWKPEYLRAFYRATYDHIWIDVLNELYDAAHYMQQALTPSTGLLPQIVITTDPPTPAYMGWPGNDTDWLLHQYEGEFTSPASEICRNITLDYALNGDKRALQVLDRIAAWAIEVHTEITGDPPKKTYNPKLVTGGYYLDGRPILFNGQTWHDGAMSNAFTHAATVSKFSFQDAVNKGWWDLVTTRTNIDEEEPGRILSALLISGNHFKAVCTPIPPAPTPKPPKVGQYIDDYEDYVNAGVVPPASEPIQLLSFDFTNPRYHEGVQWSVEYLHNKKNPMGNGFPGNYDGTNVGVTYTVTTSMIEGKPDLEQLLQQIVQDGHEIANTTHSGSSPHSIPGQPADWNTEITNALSALDRLIPGFGRSIGWLAPTFLYDKNMFQAIKDNGYWYDSSIEEGFKWGQDGTNFLWPYTLNEGSPGHSVLYDWGSKKFQIDPVPGLWELPRYVLIVPPHDVSPEYGINYDLRKKMKGIYDWFSVEEGKVSGMDFNLWFLFNLQPDEVLAILRYTLDLRLMGNYCPMILQIDTQFYSQEYQQILLAEKPDLASTVPQRKQVIEDFTAYAQTKQDLRMVSKQNTLEWVREHYRAFQTPTPTPICNTPTPTPTATPSYFNIGLNKYIGASSEYASLYKVENANDADKNTIWASGLDNTAEYIYIDLGREEDICGYRLNWYDAYYATDYQLYFSADGKSWSKIADFSNMQGGINEIIIDGSVPTRYIGFYFTGKNEKAFALREFEVYKRIQ